MLYLAALLQEFETSIRTLKQICTEILQNTMHIKHIYHDMQ